MYLNREEDSSKAHKLITEMDTGLPPEYQQPPCGLKSIKSRASVRLGKRNKPVEAADTPDSARGRGEKKAINDLDRDFWNNNDSSTVQQRWSSYPPKEFVLNISPYAPYGDPRLTLNGAVSGGQKGAATGHGDDGGGPYRSDSVKSMVTEGVKAGRWQTVQGHMQSGGLRPSNYDYMNESILSRNREESEVQQGEKYSSGVKVSVWAQIKV
ncbi:hypothetical protein PAMP_019827 [Pampus punctatissimus]